MGRLHAIQATFQQVSGNNEALNFTGTFPDPINAQFTKEAFSDVFTHVTAASEDLQCPVCHAVGHL